MPSPLRAISSPPSPSLLEALRHQEVRQDSGDSRVCQKRDRHVNRFGLLQQARPSHADQVRERRPTDPSPEEVEDPLVEGRSRAGERARPTVAARLRRPYSARDASPETTRVCGLAQLNRSGKYRSNIAAF